ncbi:hypothetical protein B566_EDAN015630 [Ephemera danica]|nr:hypothetical protein B566_EDAN015630 [Ephemera danica]
MDALQEPEAQRVIRAYENSVSIDIHCSPEGDWNEVRLKKEACTKGCQLRVNPDDQLSAGSEGISGFTKYISKFIKPAGLEQLLEPSDVVGNIRFSHPTLYVFPGGQGDAALFGINGFNMLVDGGFSRKSCFWDFTRHLDRLDAVMLTRINNSNINGITSVLKRKRVGQVYPQIGHFFCNITERKNLPSPDGDKDRDALLIDLLDEGHEMVVNLRQLDLKPHACYRDIVTEPINLYHKVGHGKLDLYVISPVKDSKEVKEFLIRWNTCDQKLFSAKTSGTELKFPLQNLVSICALLVWQPANPTDTITRILFPGSTPQHKIFEGLEKLKHLEFLKYPVCTARSLQPHVTKTKGKIIERTSPDSKIIKNTNSQLESKVAGLETKPLKSTEKSPKISLQSSTTAALNGKSEKMTKQIKSTGLEKPQEQVEKTKNERNKETKDIKSRIDIVSKTETKAQIKPKYQSKPPSERKIQRTPSSEKKSEKPSSPTPKKVVESKIRSETKVLVQSKQKPKSSPTSTPAKSAKEANNRKVVESKIQANKQFPSKTTESSGTSTKVSDKKYQYKKTKPSSPKKQQKMPTSPSKVSSAKSTPAQSIKSEKEGVIKIEKIVALTNVISDDTQARSTDNTKDNNIEDNVSVKLEEADIIQNEYPLEDMCASQDKIDDDIDLRDATVSDDGALEADLKECDLKSEDTDEIKRDDIEDTKENISIVDSQLEEETEDDVELDKKLLDTDERLSEIDAKETDIEEEFELRSDDGENKHVRDEEESEKERKSKDLEEICERKETTNIQDQSNVDASETEDKDGETEEIENDIKNEIEIPTDLKEVKLLSDETKEMIADEVTDIICSAQTVVATQNEPKDTCDEDVENKLESCASEEKNQISSEKIRDDGTPEDELKEQKAGADDGTNTKSQPDEKISAMETSATTAPSMPEDERIPLDEIKEGVEEKYIKEDTKEKEGNIEQREATLPQTPKLPEVITSVPFDQQQPTTNQRDIVKTPDEVADLPMHEEVDATPYEIPTEMNVKKKVENEYEERVTQERDNLHEGEIPEDHRAKSESEDQLQGDVRLSTNEVVTKDNEVLTKENKDETDMKSDLQVQILQSDIVEVCSDAKLDAKDIIVGDNVGEILIDKSDNVEVPQNFVSHTDEEDVHSKLKETLLEDDIVLDHPTILSVDVSTVAISDNIMPGSVSESKGDKLFDEKVSEEKTIETENVLDSNIDHEKENETELEEEITSCQNTNLSLDLRTSATSEKTMFESINDGSEVKTSEVNIPDLTNEDIFTEKVTDSNLVDEKSKESVLEEQSTLIAPNDQIGDVCTSATSKITESTIHEGINDTIDAKVNTENNSEMIAEYVKSVKDLDTISIDENTTLDNDRQIPTLTQYSVVKEKNLDENVSQKTEEKSEISIKHESLTAENKKEDPVNDEQFNEKEMTQTGSAKPENEIVPVKGEIDATDDPKDIENIKTDSLKYEQILKNTNMVHDAAIEENEIEKLSELVNEDQSLVIPRSDLRDNECSLEVERAVSCIVPTKLLLEEDFAANEEKESSANYIHDKEDKAKHSEHEKFNEQSPKAKENIKSDDSKRGVDTREDIQLPSPEGETLLKEANLETHSTSIINSSENDETIPVSVSEKSDETLPESEDIADTNLQEIVSNINTAMETGKEETTEIKQKSFVIGSDEGSTIEQSEKTEKKSSNEPDETDDKQLASNIKDDIIIDVNKKSLQIDTEQIESCMITPETEITKLTEKLVRSEDMVQSEDFTMKKDIEKSINVNATPVYEIISDSTTSTTQDKGQIEIESQIKETSTVISTDDNQKETLNDFEEARYSTDIHDHAKESEKEIIAVPIDSIIDESIEKKQDIANNEISSTEIEAVPIKDLEESVDVKVITPEQIHEKTEICDIVHDFESLNQNAENEHVITSQTEETKKSSDTLLSSEKILPSQTEATKESCDALLSSEKTSLKSEAVEKELSHSFDLNLEKQTDEKQEEIIELSAEDKSLGKTQSESIKYDIVSEESKEIENVNLKVVTDDSLIVCEESSLKSDGLGLDSKEPCISEIGLIETKLTADHILEAKNVGEEEIKDQRGIQSADNYISTFISKQESERNIDVAFDSNEDRVVKNEDTEQVVTTLLEKDLRDSVLESVENNDEGVKKIMFSADEANKLEVGEISKLTSEEDLGREEVSADSSIVNSASIACLSNQTSSIALQRYDVSGNETELKKDVTENQNICVASSIESSSIPQEKETEELEQIITTSHSPLHDEITEMVKYENETIVSYESMEDIDVSACTKTETDLLVSDDKLPQEQNNQYEVSQQVDNKLQVELQPDSYETTEKHGDHDVNQFGTNQVNINNEEKGDNATNFDSPTHSSRTTDTILNTSPHVLASSKDDGACDSIVQETSCSPQNDVGSTSDISHVVETLITKKEDIISDLGGVSLEDASKLSSNEDKTKSNDKFEASFEPDAPSTDNVASNVDTKVDNEVLQNKETTHCDEIPENVSKLNESTELLVAREVCEAHVSLQSTETIENISEKTQCESVGETFEKPVSVEIIHTQLSDSKSSPRSDTQKLAKFIPDAVTMEEIISESISSEQKTSQKNEIYSQIEYEPASESNFDAKDVGVEEVISVATDNYDDGNVNVSNTKLEKSVTEILHDVKNEEVSDQLTASYLEIIEKLQESTENKVDKQFSANELETEGSADTEQKLDSMKSDDTPIDNEKTDIVGTMDDDDASSLGDENVTKSKGHSPSAHHRLMLTASSEDGGDETELAATSEKIISHSDTEYILKKDGILEDTSKQFEHKESTPAPENSDSKNTIEQESLENIPQKIISDLAEPTQSVSENIPILKSDECIDQTKIELNDRESLSTDVITTSVHIKEKTSEIDIEKNVTSLLRNESPMSDSDHEMAPSTPHSDISSGQMSKAPQWDDQRPDSRHSDLSDKDPQSPVSASSQQQFVFQAKEQLAMTSSLYGALPEDELQDIASSSTDKKSQGVRTDPTTFKQDIAKTANEDVFHGFQGSPRHGSGEQNIHSPLNNGNTFDIDTGNDNERLPQFVEDVVNQNQEFLQTSSTTKPQLSNAFKSEQNNDGDDPIEGWGKPLGLPSPAPPTNVSATDNQVNGRGTPKKERKITTTRKTSEKIKETKQSRENISKSKSSGSPMYFDLAYVPHNGNSNYTQVEFFKKVRARYYVFSGLDPSREVYSSLLEAKESWDDKDLEVTIIPTYDTDTLGYWVAENEEALSQHKIDLSPSASRCTINLQDHETSCSAYRLEF